MLVVAALATQAQRAAGQQKQRVRWEYAELTYMATYPEGGKATHQMSIEMPKTSQTGKSFVELGKKLKLDVKKNISTSMLNALGDEGWELVSHNVAVTIQRGNTTRITYSWALKRRK